MRRLDSEPSLKSDFGLTETVYNQRFSKPKRPSTLSRKNSRGKSPRKSTEV